jgi:hypothetical protein
MPSAESELFDRVLNELSPSGLLLESDAELLNVAGFIAGEPVRGSWWGHPKSHTIFRIHSESVHTATGAHEKVVESWDSWIERSGLTRSKLTADQAKNLLEETAVSLGGDRAAHSLPWLIRESASQVNSK